MIRVPHVCDGGGPTTVGCHYRLAGVSGMGYKAPDLFIAWGCAACHRWVDTHHDDATKVLMLEGIVRTQDVLIREGKIRW